MLLGSYGCKKQKRYEEDPKKSRKTPQTRLTGNWKVTEYTFNGNSIIQKLNSLSPINDLSDFTLQYGENSDKAWYTRIYSPNKVLFQSYDFFNNDSQFYFSYAGIYDSLCCKWFITPFKFIRNEDAYWKVTKLYENDLNIVLNTDSGQYKIFFNKR
jgi:hypothetical protein